MWPREPSVAQLGRRQTRRQRRLLADAERVDQLAVAIEVLVLEVVEQPTALADQLEEATTRVVVLLVRLEVLGEVVEALGQERDLDLGRPGVAVVGRVLLDDVLLQIGREAHVASFFAPSTPLGAKGL